MKKLKQDNTTIKRKELINKKSQSSMCQPDDLGTLNRDAESLDRLNRKPFRILYKFN